MQKIQGSLQEQFRAASAGLKAYRAANRTQQPSFAGSNMTGGGGTSAGLTNSLSGLFTPQRSGSVGSTASTSGANLAGAMTGLAALALVEGNKSGDHTVHDAMVVGSIIAQAQGRSHTGAGPNANVRPNVSLQSYPTSSIIDTGGSLLMVDRLMRTCTCNQI